MYRLMIRDPSKGSVYIPMEGVVKMQWMWGISNVMRPIIWLLSADLTIGKGDEAVAGSFVRSDN